MNLTIDHIKPLDTKKILCATFLILESFCLFSTMFINTALAQPGTNKIAMVFYQINVINSHEDPGDCADWIVFATVYYLWGPRAENGRGTGQTIAEGCLESGWTYPLRFPTTAIVDEYPANEWRGLWLHGYHKGYFGYDRLGGRIECCLRIPSFVEFRTPVATNPPRDMFVPADPNVDYIIDYSVSYKFVNCRNPIVFFILEGELCTLPSGQYYRYPGDMTWIRGVAPPLDLEVSP